MREIKFRAWDEKREVMHHDFQFIRSGTDGNDWVVFKSDLNHDFDDAMKNPHFAQQLKIMEYTGLKDKNGIEIYEADVIQLVTANYTKIKIVCKFGTVQRTLDTGWLVDITGFYFERPDGLASFPIVNNYAGKHDLELFEVIGNVYKNPELMPE